MQADDIDTQDRVNWIRLKWAGGEHRFTLAEPATAPRTQADAIREELRRGRRALDAQSRGEPAAPDDPVIEPIGPLVSRIMGGGWTTADLEAVIHAGLLRGEGPSIRKDLHRLINEGVRARPLAENLTLAQAIVGASYVGVSPGDADGGS